MFSGASISEAMRRQKIEDAEEELKNMPALFGKAASDKAATLMILQARKNNNHESSPLSDTLTARMSLVLDEAIDANKSAEISNNTDVGYQFYSLFARISMIVNDVIGSQNKD
ncbi:hypothetical protein KKG31_07720 [Patescibacteria group bacterium]|nr:hypothetical protein [Patescibacteria group bacterium]MBU1758953.1 hypothetical protein [Patescibacteria group bacterium]